MPNKLIQTLLESNLKPGYVIAGIMDTEDPDFLFMHELFMEVAQDDSYLDNLDEYRRTKFKKDIDILRSGKRNVEMVPKSFSVNDLDIIPTQNFVKKEKVDAIIADGKFDLNSFVAVKLLNKYYLIDGHHRFVAWLLSDRKDEDVTLNIYDIDSKI